MLKLRLEELKVFHEIKNYLDDFVKFATSLSKGMSRTFRLQHLMHFVEIAISLNSLKNNS